MKPKTWKSAAARRIIALGGNASTIEAAVSIVADRLLEGILCPPTDLEAIRDRLKVTAFEPIDGLPVAGELRKDSNGFKIVYSTSLSRGRRRFTLAHELGHAVFETTGANCPRYGRELERICDMLAGEFLLPKKSFRRVAGGDIGPVKIRKLAQIFDASLMATALRCCQLYLVSVFQVDSGRVAWGYGAVRSTQHLQSDREGFRLAISQAMKGVPGKDTVFVRGREEILEWTPLNERRALFVLQSRKSLENSPHSWE